MKIYSEKVRSGSCVTINTYLRNPQKKCQETFATTVSEIISIDTFQSKAYGFDTCIKVETTDGQIGYIEKIYRY